LDADLFSLILFLGVDFRFMDMRVQVARQRVVVLEANDEVAAAPANPQR
jgi:hypothetical protein